MTRHPPSSRAICRAKQYKQTNQPQNLDSESGAGATRAALPKWLRPPIFSPWSRRRSLMSANRFRSTDGLARTLERDITADTLRFDRGAGAC